MAFRISLLDDQTSIGSLQIGEIVIGGFTERFESSLEYWSRSDYESHWQESVQRVLNQEKSACLISSITDPASANFLFWWPIYVLDDKSLRIQNQILFLKDCELPFDEKQPFLSLRTRKSKSEDGRPVSEWKITANELRNWLSQSTSQVE